MWIWWTLIFLYNNYFQAFNQKNSLEAHSLKHSGQRPFACSFCAMKFAQRGNLRAHILRVHKLSKEAGQIKCAHCTCLVITNYLAERIDRDIKTFDAACF
jgi:hypothetical protein